MDISESQREREREREMDGCLEKSGDEIMGFNMETDSELFDAI